MRILRWTFLLAAGFLVAFAIAGKTNLVRPDTLAAISCLEELVPARDKRLDAIGSYRDTFSSEARKKDLPPELMVAIVYGHQRYQSPPRQFAECFGSALGADLSLGLSQIRLSTAADNAGDDFDAMTPLQFRTLRRELMTPETNIMHQANELRLLLDRQNRYPGIGANTLIHDPGAMALLMSEYRAGRRSTPSDDSRLSANAFADMRELLGDEVYLFGRDQAGVEDVPGKVRIYLDTIYCESGLFNTGVCESWQQSPTH